MKLRLTGITARNTVPPKASKEVFIHTMFDERNKVSIIIESKVRDEVWLKVNREISHALH